MGTCCSWSSLLQLQLVQRHTHSESTLPGPVRRASGGRVSRCEHVQPLAAAATPLAEPHEAQPPASPAGAEQQASCSCSSSCCSRGWRIAASPSMLGACGAWSCPLDVPYSDVAVVGECFIGYRLKARWFTRRLAQRRDGLASRERLAFPRFPRFDQVQQIGCCAIVSASKTYQQYKSSALASNASSAPSHIV